jgi:hypothetical protein
MLLMVEIKCVQTMLSPMKGKIIQKFDASIEENSTILFQIFIRNTKTPSIRIRNKKINK